MEQQNGETLIKLANYRMPFGKYANKGSSGFSMEMSGKI